MSFYHVTQATQLATCSRLAVVGWLEFRRYYGVYFGSTRNSPFIFCSTLFDWTIFEILSSDWPVLWGSREGYGSVALPCELGPELRLGRETEKKKSAKIIEGTSENRKIKMS